MTLSFKSIASWSIVMLILMQFVPLKRINSPVVSDIQLPEFLKSSLKKACYDCHSNETRWDEIAYIAPASWLIFNIVASGRNTLNFSIWNNQKTAKSQQLTTSIRKVVLEGSVHQPLYYLWKPDAHLTINETKMILKWMN